MVYYLDKHRVINGQWIEKDGLTRAATVKAKRTEDAVSQIPHDEDFPVQGFRDTDHIISIAAV